MRSGLTAVAKAFSKGKIVTDYAKLFIDGSWVDPIGTGRLDVIDPTTDEAFATVPEGAVADIDRAVAAAKQAFGPWFAGLRWAVPVREPSASRNDE